MRIFAMKKDIHPNYNDAVVRCACGNEIKTRSTVKEMHVNTEGRVDRLQKRFAEGMY